MRGILLFTCLRILEEYKMADWIHKKKLNKWINEKKNKVQIAVFIFVTILTEQRLPERCQGRKHQISASPPSTLIWSSDFLSLAHFSFLHKTEMHQILCYVHICLFIHYSHQPLGCKLHVLFTTVFPILKTLSTQ